MLPHMSGGTDQAGLLEVRIKNRIFNVLAVLLEIRDLLTQRRVTGRAEDHGRRLHVEQLPIDTWTLALAVDVALPVLVLLWMAPASDVSGRRPRRQVPRLWVSVRIASSRRYPTLESRSPQ